MKKIFLFVIILPGLFNCCTKKEADPVPVPDPLEIGDKHEGGTIFFLDSTGQHGKVCKTLVGILGSFKWDEAVEECDSLVHEGYDDWYLPSLEELELMYDELHLPNRDVFQNTVYWSSTNEGFGSIAWGIDFETGVRSQYVTQHTLAFVRPVRKF